MTVTSGQQVSERKLEKAAHLEEKQETDGRILTQIYQVNREQLWTWKEGPHSRVDKCSMRTHMLGQTQAQTDA